MEPMLVELLKSSPAMVAVIIIVFAFLKSQRDITNDFKEVVKEIHSDMKIIHDDTVKSRDSMINATVLAAQGSTQNSLSTNNNTAEIQKLSIEVRRLADNWRKES